MVVSHHFSIECDKSFHGRQGTRDVGVTVEGAVVEERVTAVEHPSPAYSSCSGWPDTVCAMRFEG